MSVETRTLPAKMNQWETILALLESHLESSQASEIIKYKIYVSAEEIFTNIASYAYGEDADDNTRNMAEVSCGFCNEDKTKYQVSFRDWGMPYNPLECPDPDIDIPLEERRIGGLGIYMVKKFMDEIEYRFEDGCNILTFAKNIKGDLNAVSTTS